jgi:hypothetical protein
MAGSSAGTFPAHCDGTFGVGNINYEKDIDIIQESCIAVKKEEDTGIKQEEIPEDTPLSCTKSEPDEVSYGCVCVCVSVIGHILPMPRNVNCVMSVFVASCTLGDENGLV